MLVAGKLEKLGSSSRGALFQMCSLTSPSFGWAKQQQFLPLLRMGLQPGRAGSCSKGPMPFGICSKGPIPFGICFTSVEFSPSISFPWLTTYFPGEDYFLCFIHKEQKLSSLRGAAGWGDKALCSSLTLNWDSLTGHSHTDILPLSHCQPHAPITSTATQWLQGRLAHLSEQQKITCPWGKEKPNTEKCNFPLDQPARWFHPGAMPSVAETQAGVGEQDLVLGQRLNVTLI